MSLRFGVRTNIRDSLPRDAPARINAGMRGAIGRSTRFLRGIAFENINKNTGRTAGTIGSTLTGGGSSVSGHVGSNDKVARILEFGSRPHVIRPRNAKALKFNVGGRTVFARSVNHPGTRPYRWLERSGERGGAYAKAELAGVFARVFGV